MTEINNLLNEGNTDCSHIRCPRCNDSKYVMWDKIDMNVKSIMGYFLCSGCNNTFMKSINMQVITRNIPTKFLLITEAPDE